MTYAAYLDDDWAGDVATTTGWKHVREFVDSIEPPNELVSFVEHGISEDLSKLEEDLKLAVSQTSGALNATLSGLLRLLRKRGTRTVFVVTDEVG